MRFFWHDIRYALRIIKKKPTFATIVILTIALGIGANTAVFSFLNALLLRPLPYKDADRLVRITTNRGNEEGRLSMLELKDLNRETAMFESVAPYIPAAQYNYSGGGTPEELSATLVSRDLFKTLDVSFLHGGVWPENFDIERNFGVVLTYDLWMRRFSGNPNIIGRKITLDAASVYTIYGIMPKEFHFPGNVQLLRSIGINRYTPNYIDRSARNVYAFAKLKPGITYEQASAKLQAFSRKMIEVYPNLNTGMEYSITPLRTFYFGDMKSYLWLLQTATVLVLLIACTNVMNLYLAHSSEREREIGIRTALGAQRKRLVQQLLTESVFLAGTGGFIGIICAYMGVKFLHPVIQKELPIPINFDIDLYVLIFASVAIVFTGILSGLAPAFHASNLELNTMLKEGAKGSSIVRWPKKLLIMAEIALALAIMIGAGLLTKSFYKLQQAELGFNPNNLLTMRIALPWLKYTGDQGPAKTKLFFTTLQNKLASLPGVESAGMINKLPLSGEYLVGKSTFTIEGQSNQEQQLNPYINNLIVDQNYFRTMGINLIQGRNFNEFDTEAIERIAIVNRHLAEFSWPGQNPIGKRLNVSGIDLQPQWTTIVGVVNNVKHDNIQGDHSYDIFFSYKQVPSIDMYLLMRTKIDPLTLSDAVTKAIWSKDPDQSIFNIATMNERIQDMIWKQRISGLLFITFGVIALVLSSIGIYGVMSYLINQRTREIGIRIAVGARRFNIFKLIFIDCCLIISLGLFAGLCITLVAARLIRNLLFNVTITDPLIYVTITLLLAIVAFVSCYIPTRRAMRVDPIEALRGDT